MDDKSWKEAFDSIGWREENNFIQLLLNSGLDVNALDKNGTTVLSYAAQCGNQRLVEVLVQKGAECDVANSDGSKPLHIAAQYGHKDIVEFFLNIGIPVDTRDNDENTPLHFFSEKSTLDRESCQELVHLLVDRNADLNAVNRYGCTPLLLAAENKSKDIVELLIKSGANVLSCDEEEFILLHHACSHGWLDLVEYLVNQEGCDLDAKTGFYKTPLLLACEHSHSSVVKYLVESGADVNCWDFYLNRPLHYVCVYELLKRIDIIEHLLKAGADCNNKNVYGRSALTCCIRENVGLEEIALLLRNNAYFQSEDYDVMSKNPDQYPGILKNTEFCTLAVINYFNCVDLRKIYEIPLISVNLPAMERLKIATRSHVAIDIAESVDREIQSKGFCNILNVRPIVLKRLCVLSLVKHYNNSASLK